MPKCVEACQTFVERDNIQLRTLQMTRLNGQLGTVLPISDKSAGARVPVALMSSTVKLSVKPENLQIAPVNTHGITKDGTATVFDVKTETHAEYWECTEQMPTVPGTTECDQHMNDGDDDTHDTQGYRAGGRLGHGRIIVRPTEHQELRVRVRLAVDRRFHPHWCHPVDAHDGGVQWRRTQGDGYEW